ncbi:MAG: UvrD-helicase domain-containing protein, partial [Candidatus Lloydbacteria bacterium]|nr:UvrD-helicase domain-containing protein [Candidatus Lloydbacteria bacterium]
MSERKCPAPGGIFFFCAIINRMEELDELNEAQKTAVLYVDGPLLIIAGAGAGKTKTLTHRISYLIKKGVPPERILAVTFTNKAAKEMRERVASLLGRKMQLVPFFSDRSAPMVSTFHSLGVQILRENGHALGIKKQFSIFDDSDSISAIKEALKRAELDPKQFEPRRMKNAISRYKEEGLSYVKFAEQVGNEYFPRMVEKVWREYDAILKKEHALDFDDLLLQTLLLLREHAAVREAYQRRWQYVHIDEYQDTNAIQYEISQLLAGEHKNICVVGDLDQSIYSWRGADFRNILNFEKDYPGAKIVLLEKNYRSTKTILAAANDVIKQNKQRKEKNLFTDNKDGEKIGLYAGYDENDEARFVANKASALIASGVKPNEI